MKYRYLWNRAEDEHGRNLGLMDGYVPGNPLCVAYEGEITGVLPEDTPSRALAALYRIFNIDRPTDYRGPSLSVGSVVEFIDGERRRAYACASVGWIVADISTSPILPTDPRWRV